MLLCVSVSHRTTGFDLLDRLSSATATTGSGELLDAGADGAVLLSTCNRIEAYLDVADDAAGEVAERVVERFAAAVGMTPPALLAEADIVSGTPALRHLFAVAAGLESLAVGEDEIIGQVRRAYQDARSTGATTPAIDRAFQRAAQVSRQVRSATDLGGQGRSLVRLALRLAGHRVTDWRTARVLVVGTGNYAATTIANLHALGAVDVSVYSRTGRADAFATKYRIAARDDLAAAIADADVVVTCTRSYTVRAEDLPRDGAARLVIDLGMPRNVEPDVAEVPGVELLDLQVIAMHARLPELALETAASGMVDSAADAAEAERLAAPAIVALRRHVFDALDAEIDRVRARAATPEAAELAAEALRHLSAVLLHGPSELARDAAAAGRIAEFEAALASVHGLDPHAAPVDQHPVTRLPLPADSDDSDAAAAR